MSSPLTIALIEDNTLLRDELCSFLDKQGWETHGADCGEQLNQLLLKYPLDLVVLDVNLPHEDGYSIATRLRQSHPRIGIIILSARTRPSDRVLGYQTGADIYLTKPTHTEELVAAIRNLSHRLKPVPIRHLILDSQSRRLIAGERLSCSLSTSETCLLKIMALQPDGAVGIEFLLNAMSREMDEVVTRSSITVLISRLRTKVEAMVPEQGLISSLRKVGYRLDQPLTVI